MRSAVTPLLAALLLAGCAPLGLTPLAADAEWRAQRIEALQAIPPDLLSHRQSDELAFLLRHQEQAEAGAGKRVGLAGYIASGAAAIAAFVLVHLTFLTDLS